MKHHRVCSGIGVLTFVLAAGCGSGPSPAGATGAIGEARQASTAGAPLWSAVYAPKPGGASVHEAAVDDAGNTIVVGRTPQEDDVAYVFGAGGALEGTVFLGGGAIDPRSVRANATGFAVASNESTAAGPVPRLDRSTAIAADGGAALAWTYRGAVGSQAAGADACPDGTTVLASFDAGGADVTDFDAGGAVLWTSAIAMATPSKVRCLGSGRIVVAGLTEDGSAAVTELESTGQQGFAWTAGTSGASAPGFDVDGSTIYVGVTQTSGASTHVVVYAIDGGSLVWAWASDGTSDTFAAIAASGAVSVAGARGPDAYVVQIDTAGNALWTVDDPESTPAAGVAVDSAGETLVCSASNETRYDASGAVVEATDGLGLGSAKLVDVTGGVGRCAGDDAASPGSIRLVAFQAP